MDLVRRSVDEGRVRGILKVGKAITRTATSPREVQDYASTPESITIATDGQPQRMIGVAKLQRIILGALVAAFVLYGGDYAILRVRGSSGFDTVNIILGTPMKDGRVQIFTGANQAETCVRSLFPHFGYRPCWYVRQNATQLVENRAPQSFRENSGFVRARDFCRRDGLAYVTLRVIGDVYQKSAQSCRKLFRTDVSGPLEL